LLSKNQIKDAFLSEAEDKLKALQKSIAQVQSSIEGEEKSSAGDKYETARAMSQGELDRLNGQQSKLAKLINQLKSLSMRDVNEVSMGALVKTNTRTLFFIGPFGKIVLEGKTILALSAGSPIGQAYLGKKVGEQVIFNGSTEEILEIL